MTKGWGSLRLSLALASLVVAAGCTQDMKDQPKVEALQESGFYADGRSARAPVAGTVARGQLNEDDGLYRGLTPEAGFVETLPLPLSNELVARGRVRYDIFCSPCHDRAGDGRGMIVRRGFKQPPSFHDARLRGMPVGYLFDVSTKGFGQMSGYASQIPVEDRWAIVAYVRALQLSRQVPLAELDEAQLQRVREGAVEASGDSEGDGHHD